MFHDVAHNPDVVRSYPRPFEWWIEGTATLAAGTIRGCTGNLQCQEIQLDPRPRWGLPRLDIGFFDETSYQGYDAHPYRLQEFWLYLATEAGATNLGFLLPLFEVEGGPSATSFDTLLQNGDMNGFVVEGGFAELHYNWVTSIVGHTDDSTGGGYGDEDRVCTTCAVPDGNRFGNTTGILPDAEGNAAVAVDLAPLSTAIYRLELADGQTLADVVAGLELDNPNGNLQYVVFEDGGFAYIVVINTDINSAGGTSSGSINISPEVPDNPCQGAACPDAEPSDGETWGDPHIFTLDGGIYTFMATGDYILSESTDPNDGFVVQVRFRPFEGPTWAHVDSAQWSANEAVAMNIHGDIVEFYAVDDYAQPLAVINGTEVPAGDAVIPLPNGGTVSLKGRRASASWADGTSLTAELNTSLRGDWSIAGRVNLSLPASRWKKVQGLMGNNDGIVKNDLRLRDGTQLALDPTPQGYNFSSEQLTRELYSGPFRSSWLVQSYESLFSRGSNRYDPFYPSEFISLDDLDPNLIAMAENACGLQGIRSAAVLSRCVLDVANTGDDIFAALAAVVDPQNPGVTVSPRTIYFTSAEPRELTAFVKGQVDNREVVWSANAGSISGSGNTVLYTPPLEKGDYTITATLMADPSISGSATVIVGEPLVITPPAATLAANESLDLQLFGTGSLDVTWSASGGEVLGSGNSVTYLAPSEPGDYTVTATLRLDASVKAIASIGVVDSSLSPLQANLAPGASRSFTWKGASNLPITWSATGGAIQGNGNTVTYTAPPNEGTYTLTATALYNEREITAQATAVVERQTLTIVSPQDGDTVNSNVLVRGTVPDNVEMRSLMYAVNSDSPQNVTNSLSDSSFVFSISGTSFPDGLSTITVEAEDVLGNRYRSRVSVVYDRQAAPAGGADIVVFNDINIFDNHAMTNLNNVRLVENLVNFSVQGPRDAGTLVWFDRGRNSRCYQSGHCFDAGLASMRSTIESFGFIIDELDSTSGSITSIPSEVKSIFLWNPTVHFTPEEISAFKQFASEGGRVVFIGEWDGYYGSTGLDVENKFLADLGAVMRNTGGAVDCGYTILSAASLRPHQITEGLTNLMVGCASVIELGPNDYPLFFDTSNSYVLAGVAAINVTDRGCFARCTSDSWNALQYGGSQCSSV